MDSNNGWDRLTCEFFYAVCLRVLGPYFASLGFIGEKTKINGVVFKRNGLFIEVGYLPESAPNYSPSLIVGIGDYKYDDTGKTTGVPAWSILTDNDEARRYSFWKFGDEAELASVLTKLKIEVIEQHIRPLWEDKVKLEDAIENFG